MAKKELRWRKEFLPPTNKNKVIAFWDFLRGKNWMSIHNSNNPPYNLSPHQRKDIQKWLSNPQFIILSKDRKRLERILKWGIILWTPRDFLAHLFFRYYHQFEVEDTYKGDES